MKTTFVKLDNSIIDIDTIECINDARLDELILIVSHRHGTDICTGFFALELLWLVKPSALEGRWKHWRKHAWSFHNIVVHPLMQIAAWLRLYRLAIWMHDKSVPKPIKA